MKKKTVPFFSKAPYDSTAQAYLGKERGNLARTVAPKAKKRIKPSYKIPKTPRTSGFGWGGN